MSDENLFSHKQFGFYIIVKNSRLVYGDKPCKKIYFVLKNKDLKFSSVSLIYFWHYVKMKFVVRSRLKQRDRPSYYLFRTLWRHNF